MVSGIKIKDLGLIKQNVRNIHRCPLCGESINIGVELSILKQLESGERFPYPHIHLHGDPLHAMICYIDKNLTIRSIGVARSIEISRDSNTFGQIMKKWSNPF
ncbi:MAG: hypothetical protein ACTSQP_05210 [Promethearchaeota archaeon]